MQLKGFLIQCPACKNAAIVQEIGEEVPGVFEYADDPGLSDHFYLCENANSDFNGIEVVDPTKGHEHEDIEVTPITFTVSKAITSPQRPKKK